jgi:lysophospholipase L1-like esterase
VRSLPWALPALVALAVPAAAAEPFELKDGDRVVLIGGTLIEREQRYGYWETALTSRWPERNITFRNLGWSGDTVWGEARAGFDTPKEGYERLVKHTLALKPTVIIIGYGTNESFAGEAGLPRFKAQLNKLLDDLAPSKARVLFILPVCEKIRLRTPNDQTSAVVQNIHLYSRAISEIARSRGHKAIGLSWPINAPTESLSSIRVTDNGLHLNEYGYRFTTSGLEAALGLSPRRYFLELKGPGKHTVTSEVLTYPPAPDAMRDAPWPGVNHWLLGFDGLKAGTYSLIIDGRTVTKKDVEMGTFAEAIPAVDWPDMNQAEQLRLAIVRKNELFFHRYRPQNETYLFGFRKHEQGQNAREIPLFDPLVEEQEKVIAKLRRPS